MDGRGKEGGRGCREERTGNGRDEEMEGWYMDGGRSRETEEDLDERRKIWTNGWLADRGGSG